MGEEVVMERLTYRESGKAWAKLKTNCTIEEQREFGRKSLEKLASYEDLGEPEDIKVKIDKETPVKPTNYCGYACRVCNGRLARQTDLVKQNYCHHCGQKVDWR